MAWLLLTCLQAFVLLLRRLGPFDSRTIFETSDPGRIWLRRLAGMYTCPWPQQIGSCNVLDKNVNCSTFGYMSYIKKLLKRGFLEDYIGDCHWGYHPP